MRVGDLAAVLLASLEDDAVAQLAERLRPHLTTEQRLLTATEVAERLGLHPKTVVRMAREGRLPAIKIGTGWRFAPDQLAVRPAQHPTPATESTPRPNRGRATGEPASVRAIRGETTRRAA